MALGFVVERFALFVQYILYIIPIQTKPCLYGAFPRSLGISLVAFGILIAILAFFRYRKVEKEIDGEMYKPSFSFTMILALFVVDIGIFLIAYLL